MAKIIGNTTATPMAIPDWNQTDETKANYIKNKPTLEAGIGVDSIQSSGCNAGIMGYYYSNIVMSEDKKSAEITLTDNQNLIENPDIIVGYTQGDVISVINGSKYPDCATINEVNGNVITVSITNNFGALKSVSDPAMDDLSIYVYNKPDIGIVSLGWYSHAEGEGTQALERASHAEGRDTKAKGQYSHTEGRQTEAAYCGHAEGRNSKATNEYAHAEGSGTTASGKTSHAEGVSTEAIGDYSHSEGHKTKSRGANSHSEGYLSETGVEGYAAHAEGGETRANGLYSHSEGRGCKANGEASHAEGHYTVASSNYQHVQGKYNAYQDADGNDLNYAHIVGNGYSSNRRNCHTLSWDGTAWFADNVYVGEGNYDKKKLLATQEYAMNLVDNNPGQKGTGSEAEVFNDYTNNTASGQYAHAEGSHTQATGNRAHSEGAYTKAKGDSSHAEGNESVASGKYSHAEGLGTIASQNYQHVQGRWNVEDTNNEYIHIVGNGYNKTNRRNIHALDWDGNGWFTGDIYVNTAFDTDGSTTTSGSKLATEQYVETCIEEVINNIEIPDSGVGISGKDISENAGVFSEVFNYDENNTNISDVHGYKEYKFGPYSHSEGASIATGSYAHSEGSNTFAQGEGAHSEGLYNYAEGRGSHAEGGYNTASGDFSHAEGETSTAKGAHSHTEGYGSDAEGEASHAEGYSTIATGLYCHAEGESTTASGIASHAEGSWTEATADYAHAEGNYTDATGIGSHAEGGGTLASGDGSHAEGGRTVASGKFSHAEGDGTVACGENQHVEGRLNLLDVDLEGNPLNTYIHIAGNGTRGETKEDLDTRSNAYTLDWDGNGWFAGNVTVGKATTDDDDDLVLVTKGYLKQYVAEILASMTSEN